MNNEKGDGNAAQREFGGHPPEKPYLSHIDGGSCPYLIPLDLVCEQNFRGRQVLLLLFDAQGRVENLP